MALEDFLQREIKDKAEFRCVSCGNSCQIRQIEIKEKTYPFGGLCSKFENARLSRDSIEGRDYVAVRNKLMFEDYGAEEIAGCRGTVGIPMALSTFDWFPFFSKFFNSLGYQVVTSDEIARHDLRTKAPICYPGEVAHANVRDLLRRGVDYVFLPYAMGDELPWTPTTSPPMTWEDKMGKGWIDGYLCHMARGVPGLIKISIEGDEAKKLLTPKVSISSRMWKGTLTQLTLLAQQLGVNESDIRKAATLALTHYRQFRRALAQAGHDMIRELGNKPTVILAGHPYIVCSNRINLALPRKIISRGYNVVPVDMLPSVGDPPIRRNLWRATQMIENAITFANKNDNYNLCFISCFYCSVDAMLEHRFRQLASKQTYCRLELDSHTAHAGFDTRIGAFIDILEQERSPKSAGGRN
jgi:predicted nucleotide-binding protein (sugar kinase/HSP70/actin superfamily)